MPLGPLLLFGNDQASNPGASVLTLYCTDPITSGSSAGSLTTTVPAASTSTTGWTVATTAAGNFSRQSYNAEVPSTGFGTTSQPSGAPLFQAQDCWRYGPSTGTFSLGTWYSSVSVIGVTSGGDQDGRARFRIWRSAQADGAGVASQVYADSFNRANESPMVTGGWATQTGDSGLAINTNAIRGSTAAVDNASRYSGLVWPNDHYAECTLAAFSTDDGGPIVRSHPNQQSFYLLDIVGGASPVAQVWKNLNGTGTQIGADVALTGLLTTDVLRLEVQGTTLKTYRNGSLLHTVTGQSDLTSGAPGIMVFNNTATFVADNFAAGVYNGPTEITQPSGVMVGTTVTNLSTTVAQSSSASAGIAMFWLNNEYLFLQTAWEITGAGGAADRDVLVRYGSMGATDGSGLVTAAFLANSAAVFAGGGLYQWYYQNLVEDLV